MKLVFNILPLMSTYLPAWFLCWMYMQTVDFRKLTSKFSDRKSLFLKVMFILSLTPGLNLFMAIFAILHVSTPIMSEFKNNVKRTWKSFEE
jgi:hypothetical protein